MNQKLLSLVFAIMLAALGLTSCNSSMNGDDTGDLTFTQIVTIEAMSEKGTTFTYTNDKDQLVTLTTSQALKADNIKTGERVVIMFSVPRGTENSTTATIYLIGYAKIVNDVLLKGTGEEYDEWMSYDLQQPAFWMSGRYLNAAAYANVDKQPQKLVMVADESTLGEKYPTVYFIYIPEANPGMVWRTIYASYDMSWLWSDRNYDGFILNYRIDRGYQTMKFEKKDKIVPTQPAQ